VTISHARACKANHYKRIARNLKQTVLCGHIIAGETPEIMHLPMNASTADRIDGPSDADRTLLRNSLREFLSKRWAADRTDSAEATAAVWRDMAGQGLTSLGGDPAEAGLREILLVFMELGRASCPAPLLGAVAANLALAEEQSNTARALLEDLHQGKAMIALALGAFDGDAAAGRAEVRGDALWGKTAFVEGGPTATHFLIFTDTGAAVVASDAAGLKMQVTPGLAVPPFCELSFENTPAVQLNIPRENLVDIALVARLACAGRALGSAERAFELAADHAKIRKQFGQLIGQFQAVQHKLANCLISLDGARLTLDAAAEARDNGNPDWRVFAASALAFAGPALREVSIQTHRALGAIGYAEEHEAPRHFRRVHSDLARFGGVSRARAELADFVLGPVAP
jgi:acyl-CoA dehydrogenase